MPLTKYDVKHALDPEEPNYTTAASLGPDALPFLEEFINGADENLASKAAYLVGLIRAPRASEVLIKAAASPFDVVRIAAASTARHLSAAEASRVLLSFTGDRSHGVRKMVLRSAPDAPSAELVARITDMARNDPARTLRTRAAEVLQRIDRR